MYNKCDQKINYGNLKCSEMNKSPCICPCVNTWWSSNKIKSLSLGLIYGHTKGRSDRKLASFKLKRQFCVRWY